MRIGNKGKGEKLVNELGKYGKWGYGIKGRGKNW